MDISEKNKIIEKYITIEENTLPKPIAKGEILRAFTKCLSRTDNKVINDLISDFETKISESLPEMDYYHIKQLTYEVPEIITTEGFDKIDEENKEEIIISTLRRKPTLIGSIYNQTKEQKKTSIGMDINAYSLIREPDEDDFIEFMSNYNHLISEEDKNELLDDMTDEFWVKACKKDYDFFNGYMKINSKISYGLEKQYLKIIYHKGGRHYNKIVNIENDDDSEYNSAEVEEYEYNYYHSGEECKGHCLTEITYMINYIPLALVGVNCKYDLVIDAEHAIVKFINDLPKKKKSIDDNRRIFEVMLSDLLEEYKKRGMRSSYIKKAISLLKDFVPSTFRDLF